MKPGFYPADMLSAETYHAGPGVSNSGLKLLGSKTPAHFYARYLDPDRQQDRQSKPQMIGTAIHAAALEPDRFNEEYVVAEGFQTRRDKGYKAWSEEQTRHILMPHEYLNVLGMRVSLHDHPVAGGLLRDVIEFEYSVYAEDSVTGALVRIRMDMMTASGWIVDLKKCQDASPAGAAKAIANYGYYHQDAFYTDVLQWASGDTPRGFAFVFVEEEPPHAVAVYVLDAADRERGRRLYRQNLNLYARCLERDHWPCYSEGAELIELPYWERRRIDETLSTEEY